MTDKYLKIIMVEFSKKKIFKNENFILVCVEKKLHFQLG
jgi:hypothetical protein